MIITHYVTPKVRVQQVQTEWQFLYGSSERIVLGEEYDGEFTDDESLKIMKKASYVSPAVRASLLVTRQNILTGSTESYGLGNSFEGDFEDDVISF